MQRQGFGRFRGPVAAAGLVLALVLQGCTGGGGFDSAEDRANGGNGGSGGSKPPPGPVLGTPGPLTPAAQLARQCAVPRVDTIFQLPFFDQQGTLATEKAWVRSWIDETYLWYQEVPNPDAAGFATPVDYFLALKTQARTASGAQKDRFHFTQPTAQWDAESQTGVVVGYGARWALLSALPPRSVLVSQVVPGSPAALAGITRGAQVLAVDGIDVVTGNNVDGINQGLYPAKQGETHTFTVLDRGSGLARTVQLAAAPVTENPVALASVLETASGPVGYLLFNDHTAPAEKQLIAAIDKFKAAQVRDLVLDLRYNGGGFLAIASQLAYMVAGPEATREKVFERLVFNDKDPFGMGAFSDTMFSAKSMNFSVPSGQDLPYLGLGRVFVLTSKDTCSASESIVNGLRGIGVQVHLVGSTTCGKPYGFNPTDNCGTTYFSIQFQGVNAQGFGDYGDGMAPNCAARDDFSLDLGAVAEGQLAAALSLRDTGLCAPLADGGQRERAAAAVGSGGPELLLRRPPIRTERIVVLPAASSRP